MAGSGITRLHKRSAEGGETRPGGGSVTLDLREGLVPELFSENWIWFLRKGSLPHGRDDRLGKQSA